MARRHIDRQLLRRRPGISRFLIGAPVFFGTVLVGLWVTLDRPSPERIYSAAPYYRYCDDARAAGVAPLYRTDPGYREQLDYDGDGWACEPMPRRRRR